MSLVLSCMVAGFGAGGCTFGSGDTDTDADTEETSTASVSESASGGSSGDDSGGSDSETGASSTDATTGGSTSGSTTKSTSTGGMGGHCDADDDWMGAWSSLEEEVLTIVNQRRAQGANCGSAGSFGATGPLTMDPLLRCAARLHSKDMVDRDFFDHTNPDGESPWDRMAQAGYGSYSNAGENIAAGSATAMAVVDQWMDSDGHCSNIMSPDFDDLGVGYYPGGDYGHVWTQVFAKK